MKPFLKNLPSAPGVYLMKDESGDILYVGKARDLKSRVSSYFSARSQQEYRPAARYLKDRVHQVDFIVTANETEAFILENNVIKKHKPPLNIRLKDDKTYLSLRVDMSNPFPSIVPVRKIRRDGCMYFGPYSSSRSLRSTLRLLRTVVPLRDCSDREFAGRKRPCIKYEIGRCPAPCVGRIDEAAYRSNLDRALCILRGRVDILLKKLDHEMAQASEIMAFEEAARVRDRIGHLKAFTTSQNVQDVQFYDVDVVGIHQSRGLSTVAVLFFRQGKLLASRPFTFDLEIDEPELISQFLSRYYDGGRYIPESTYIPVPIQGMEEMAGCIRSLRKAAYSLKAPRRGDAVKLLQMANENARLSMEASRKVMEQTARVQDDLRSALNLNRTPVDVECVDISNTSGGQAVGAVVHFRRGSPLKSRYRRYKIKTVEGMDDYAMIREVMRRRLKRGLKESDLPDLFLIDGGVGHLNSALAVAGELEIKCIDMIGISKGETRAKAVSLDADADDRIITPGNHAGVPLPVGSPAMHLLQRIRDEAHRFAITYHRKRRNKAGLASPVDGVKGLGARKKQSLLAFFSGLKGLKKASLQEIANAPGIGPVLAERIYRELHNE
ncbi:MAG: excinuclease ABC subunit UvrC [Planctomycetota bacterium]